MMSHVSDSDLLALSGLSGLSGPGQLFGRSASPSESLALEPSVSDCAVQSFHQHTCMLIAFIDRNLPAMTSFDMFLRYCGADRS